MRPLITIAIFAASIAFVGAAWGVWWVCDVMSDVAGWPRGMTWPLTHRMHPHDDHRCDPPYTAAGFDPEGQPGDIWACHCGRRWKRTRAHEHTPTGRRVSYDTYVRRRLPWPRVSKWDRGVGHWVRGSR